MPGVIAVEIEPQAPVNLDEFWRDVEATNRCDDPKKAKQFLSSLIVRRARVETIERRLPLADAQAFFDTRTRELWYQCRSMGFPDVKIVGVEIIIRTKLDSF